MANFKSLIDTTVLLLLVVINMHGSPAATACSSSSQVMLFNSSSLEVVEEVAKDQGITEFAMDEHEIQRRVLQGGLLGKAGSLADDLTRLIGNKPFKATGQEESKRLNNIFVQYCYQICTRSVAKDVNCDCQNNMDSKGIFKYLLDASRSCGRVTVYKVYYCCNEVKCSLCCGSTLYSNNQQNSNSPQHFGSGSSGSPIAYVDMTVIAIFTTISYAYMFF